jgi:sugar phosphate permease
MPRHDAREPFPAYYTGLSTLTFLSWCFFFVNPYAFALLVDLGLAAWQANVVQSVDYLIAALSQPFIGTQLDRGNYRDVCFLALITQTVGVALLLPSRQTFVLSLLALTLVIFSISLSVVLITQVLESLLPISNRHRGISFSMFVQEAGKGMASLLAFFFLERYRDQLLCADLVSSALLFLAIYFVMRRLSEVSVPRPKSVVSVNNYFGNLRIWLRRAPVGGALLFNISLASYLSAMPQLFHRLRFDVVRLIAIQGSSE